MLRMMKDRFKSIFRVHGVSQDDIYQEEERMTEMRHLVDSLQDGYRDKSIIKDLKSEVVSNVFSEESKRKLKEMGNVELYELGVSVRKTQCPVCFLKNLTRTNLLRMQFVFDTLSRTRRQN